MASFTSFHDLYNPAIIYTKSEVSVNKFVISK